MDAVYLLIGLVFFALTAAVVAWAMPRFKP